MVDSLRLVAVVARWSWDYWDEINHDDPNLQCVDRGPNEYKHVLVKTFAEEPTHGMVMHTIQSLKIRLSNMDGYNELHSHALLDDAAWARLMAPFPRPINEPTACEPYAIIEVNGKLAGALLTTSTAGIAFVLHERAIEEEHHPAAIQ